MSRFLTSAILLTGLSLLNAQTYKDPKSGFDIVEVDPPGSATTNLYYHFSNFTSDDKNIIFASTVDGSAQVFRYEVATGKSEVVTSGTVSYTHLTLPTNREV